MSYWVLWGKTRRETGEGDDTHALVHHMLEAGAVASALWDGALAEAVRDDLCQATGVAPSEMPALLAWLASLHDLGKASPAFQAKYPKAIPELQAAGLHLGRQGQSATHHTAVRHCVLLQVLPRVLHAPGRVARLLAAVIGGHHGSWQSSPPDIPYWELGDQPWMNTRHELVEALARLFQPRLPQRWPADRLPHARGGGPTTSVRWLRRLPFPPRAWGWTATQGRAPLGAKCRASQTRPRAAG